MKRFFLSFLVLALLACLTGCAGQTETPGDLTCTLEVRCDILLTPGTALPAGKESLVPADGFLLPPTQAAFSRGETVFDVLRRVLRQEKIHFEYVDASLYDTVYIEGIGNIYEYDCGPLSGWMYCVNGEFPSLGCSSYVLEEGDVISFRYTRDMGEDLGKEVGP